jgi:hypothetical protein
MFSEPTSFCVCFRARAKCTAEPGEKGGDAGHGPIATRDRRDSDHVIRQLSLTALCSRFYFLQLSLSAAFNHSGSSITLTAAHRRAIQHRDAHLRCPDDGHTASPPAPSPCLRSVRCGTLRGHLKEGTDRPSAAQAQARHPRQH